jgi:molecular chaperone Hsp33
MHDKICSFTVADHAALGRIVRVQASLQQALSQYPYPKWAQAELAELMVLASLMASLLKNKGWVTAQVHSSGALPLLIAEATSEGQVRCYARIATTEEVDDDAVEMPESANDNDPTIGSALHLKRCYGKGGLLVITIMQENINKPSQSTVALQSQSLTEACRDYFNQSAQIATLLHSFVDIEGETPMAGGMLMQCLPQLATQEAIDPEQESQEQKWNTLTILSNTLKAPEMLDATVSLETLLHRLYHNEGVALLSTQPVFYQCRCSRERAEAIFNSITQEEKLELAEEGKIEVTCGFCHKSESFLVDDLK